MKLAVTADLHLPITSAERIHAMAREIGACAPDALAVAGDVGESQAAVRFCLEMLRKELACPILVLMGNHDLWSRDGRSRSKWERDLPQVVRDGGCVWLEGDAFVHDGVGVAGTIAWYDYSAADPGITASVRDFADNKRYFNNDAVLIDWEWSDPDFAARVSAPFLATLDRLEADAAVRRTIVVTHVPVLECQMRRDSGNPAWAFSNAYFGNLTLGREILRRSKVTHVVSGHTHIGRTGHVPLPDGRVIDARVVASHYGAPAWEWVEA